MANFSRFFLPAMSFFMISFFSCSSNEKQEIGNKNSPLTVAPAGSTKTLEKTASNNNAPKMKKGWTGLSMANLKEAPLGAPKEYKTQITHVYKASSGDKAGLKKNDLITAVNGIPVTRFQDIGNVTRGQSIGFSFTLTVYRDGKSIDAKIFIEEKPSDMQLRLKEVFEGSSMIAFEAESMNGSDKGKKISSEMYKNKVIILDFWATWCGPCRKTMPILEDLHKKYYDKGLVIIGLSNEDKSEIGKFLEKQPLVYSIGYDSFGSVKKDYEVDKLPTMFLIDKKGIVREVGIGTSHLNNIEQDIQKMLQEK